MLCSESVANNDAQPRLPRDYTRTIHSVTPGEIQLLVWTPNSCHKIHPLILLFLSVGKQWGVLRKYNKNRVCSQPRKTCPQRLEEKEHHFLTE